MYNLKATPCVSPGLDEIDFNADLLLDNIQTWDVHNVQVKLHLHLVILLPSIHLFLAQTLYPKYGLTLKIC